MNISVGDTLPDAQFIVMGDTGPETVRLRDRLAGRRVVIFGLPGAFTPTCSSGHLPSFIRTAEAFRAKDVSDILCVSVNDPHVMRVWGEQTGAAEAGVTLLADAECQFTESIGMRFDAPPVGLIARSKRYAMLVEDGVVQVLNLEVTRGTCEISGGEALLAQT